MDWNSYDKSLYAVVHGRDDLSRLWPNHFNTWESAILPSEEFVKIDEGDDFGWPYCYYDQVKNKKVLDVNKIHFILEKQQDRDCL